LPISLYVKFVDWQLLTRGAYFGERALIKQTRRAATVTAKSAVQLLKLDASAFALLLGPLEEIMKKNMESYEQPSDQLERQLESKLVLKEPTTLNVALQDLSVVGTLGTGSFGHVQLVEHKESKSFYALKTVPKALVEEMGQQVELELL
jgi:CRP-like cAMP-binding protein